MEIGILTILLIAVIAFALFFAPLFIWHHTAATAQILRRIENKLERLSLARGSELRRDSENSDKLHPDPSPIEDEAKPQSWDCPRCGECSEVGKTLQSNGKLKCPVCGLIAEVESKE